MRLISSKEFIQKSNESQNLRAVLFAIGVFVALILILWLFSQVFGLTASHHTVAHNTFYFQLAIILSTLSIILLVYLLFSYIKIYLSAPTNFTLGLLLLIATLLAHAITSSPLFYSTLGFGPMNGPFSFIPLIFTTLSAAILIYLTRQ